jgi:hypothetical protein
MLVFLPHGVLGLMVAGLLAAYVSTISTHLNWGTSYLVHDLYRRFIRSRRRRTPLRDDGPHRHRPADAVRRRHDVPARIGARQLRAAALDRRRVGPACICCAGIGGASTRGARLPRWPSRSWCRSGSSWLAKSGRAVDPNVALLVTVFATTIAWVTVTLATRPENEATLIAFYQLVRPAGPLWGRFPRKPASALRPTVFLMQLLGWVLGCAFVYSTLFGAGSALYGHTTQAAVFGVVWVISGVDSEILNSLWH